MKNIDILYLKLDSLNERIVSKKLLLNLISDMIQDKPEKYLKKLRENGKIKYIFQKYYYILSETERKTNILDYISLELVFGVLNKLNIKWYISFEKGLELNNILWQAHKKITIINNKISKKCKILESQFEFKKTKAIYINNYNQYKTKNRITQNIGINEKIYLDYIYFKKKLPIELIEKIDKIKIIEIMEKYPKSFQKKIKEKL